MVRLHTTTKKRKSQLRMVILGLYHFTTFTPNININMDMHHKIIDHPLQLKLILTNIFFGMAT